MLIQRIPEQPIPGQRLGRHIHHDPRSRRYRAPVDQVTPTSKVWTRHCGPWDQGDLGSCTGNAVAGLAMTDPVWRKGEKLTEASARRVYKLATTLDDDAVPGHWPPDDTGSTGLAACKAAVRLGFATQYLWGFGIDDLVRILSAVGPCAAGTNWLTGMDTPDDRGVVHYQGSVRGGHEYELVGVHLDTSLGAPIGECVEAQNSWGRGWGVKGTDAGLRWWAGGRFFIPLADMARALSDGGDVVTLATNHLGG